MRNETKKETNSSRTWKIKTRKQTSQVALSKRSNLALFSRSVPHDDHPLEKALLWLNKPKAADKSPRLPGGAAVPTDFARGFQPRTYISLMHENAKSFGRTLLSHNEI